MKLFTDLGLNYRRAVFVFIFWGLLTGLSGLSRGAIVEQAASIAQPVEEYEDTEELIEFLGEGEMVLLGEASHGTMEFYEWRSYISRRLVEEHGFDFIAVESDWPSHYKLNQYVKGDLENIGLGELFETFDRWPPWMWRNEVIVELTQWLRSYNKDKDFPVGFYGMDVQAETRAFNEIQRFLNETEHDLTDELLQKLNCLEPYLENVRGYIHRKMFHQESCREEIQDLYRLVLNDLIPDLALDRMAVLDIDRNLSLLVYGERRWRSHVDEELNSWNVRVEYMQETVDALRKHYGDDSKGIVWAHNTHVGDARATGMADQGRVNIGQLMREKLGEGNVRILGFGTARGTVKAGRSWGGQGQVMQIPEPVEDSIEKGFSEFNDEITLVNLYQAELADGPLSQTLGHRAIGVVYQPEREHLGNFVPTVLPARYDAFLFFQKTNALREWSSREER